MTLLPTRTIVGVLAAAALLAGCAGQSASLPAQNLQPAPGVIVGTSGEAALPDACSDPQKLKVCVKPGGTYKLKLSLTCRLGTQYASCGTVTWSKTISSKLLGAKFAPNPGNPTVETITASKTIKVGHYTQVITSKCTGVPDCDYSSKGMIWVTN
jgi:hypothetical protein